MKKIFLIICFFFIQYGVYSQVLIALLLGDKLNTGKIEFGLDAGVNFSSISEMHTQDTYHNWNLGFYFDFKMKENWYINTGVLVKNTVGIDDLTEQDLDDLGAFQDYEDFSDGTYTQKISYFTVPVLAKYRFNNNIYLEAGPQAGLMHKAWIEYNAEVDEDDLKLEGTAKQDNKDQVNRFDFGFTGGAGYKFKKINGWTVGAKYYYGITNVYKGVSGKRNSSWLIKVNVPIGGPKPPKKEKKKKEKKHKKQ